MIGKIKDYFQFNKKERNGILLLSFILFFLILFYQFSYLLKTETKTDFSDFEIEKAGEIELNADYTNASFNSIETLIFKNDFGKLIANNVGALKGTGDYLTLKCGVLNKLLSLDNEFGSINIKQIQPSVESVIINAEYTSIILGIDKNWSFNYEIDLEYGDLSSSLALDHSIIKKISLIQKKQNQFLDIQFCIYF